MSLAAAVPVALLAAAMDLAAAALGAGLALSSFLPIGVFSFVAI